MAGNVYLYYTGISLRHDTRYQTAIGLAISGDGIGFSKRFVGPILSIGPEDPLFVLTGHAIPRGTGYSMWYVSGTGWYKNKSLQESLYEIRMASSPDGLYWSTRTNRVVGLRPGIDAGVARPFVMETERGLRLWFSRRGYSFRGAGAAAYQIFTVDLDDDGMPIGDAQPLAFENPPRPDDFDSWTQSYAWVQPHGDDLVIFYNGNDFGRTGIGWARCLGGARS